MKQLTVRGVTQEISRALQEERKRRGTSLNQTVIDLLRLSLGIAGRPYDNGLSKFADTWSKAELAAFEKHTKVFEQIDRELWQ